MGLARRERRGRRTDGSDDLFRAIADPSRRRILTLLSKEELPLRRIEESFAMSRTAVIKHLRVLKSCRLVRARRQGRETIHRLNPLPLRAIRDWVSEFELLWDDRLQRLKGQVESEP
ncbi:MAG: metalloregulator ArsR/SmtB family transcription factor [Planctomycetota bacterium]